MQSLIKISQQTIWQLLGKAVTSLSTFIILGMLAHSYGKEGVGVYTLATTYLAIFYLLADFGFNAHLLKELKSQSASWRIKLKIEYQKLLGTRILWSVVLVIAAVALLPFWPFTTPDFQKTVLIGSLAILGSAIFTTNNLVFQYRLKYEFSTLSTVIGTLAGLGIFYWLVQIKQPLPYLIFNQLISWVTMAIISLLLLRKIFQNISPQYSLIFTRSLFKEAWPIAGTLALNVVYFRADAFILAFYKGVAEAGVYNLAYALFQTALVLPAFIINSYYPLMVRSLKDVKLIALVLALMGLVGTLLTYLLAPVMVNILSGPDFTGSITSLRILSLGFPVYFLSALLMMLLIIKKKYLLLLSIYGIGLVFNLLANLNFIPQYSFLAASWITVLSEGLILFLQLVVLKYFK